jgi:hypothetical protein
MYHNMTIKQREAVAYQVNALAISGIMIDQKVVTFPPAWAF